MQSNTEAAGADILSRLAALRQSYRQVKNALPWLDASVWPAEPAAFPQHAAPIQTDLVQAAPADPQLAAILPRLRDADGVRLLRLAPRAFPPETCGALFDRMEQAGMPLAILHTDMDFDAIQSLAQARPALKIIIESGPRKLIYHYTAVKQILGACPNVYLCTCNFCNWRGHEELIALGLGRKLLYGSHLPLFSADAAMAPVIMGEFDWQTKCGIAGNNLRRLLGLPEAHPPALEFKAPPPFIIDAHAHNLQPGAPDVYNMPTPDINFTPADWIRQMDAIAFEQLYLIPGETLFDPHITCRDYTAELRRHAPRRFRHMEIFHPRGDAAHFNACAHPLPDSPGMRRHQDSPGNPQGAGGRRRLRPDFRPVRRIRQNHHDPQLGNLRL